MSNGAPGGVGKPPSVPEKLTAAERACILRSLHKTREQLKDERDRLVLLDHHMSKQQKLQLVEVENEMVCLSAAINWMWRQG